MKIDIYPVFNWEVRKPRVDTWLVHPTKVSTCLICLDNVQKLFSSHSQELAFDHWLQRYQLAGMLEFGCFTISLDLLVRWKTQLCYTEESRSMMSSMPTSKLNTQIGWLQKLNWAETETQRPIIRMKIFVGVIKWWISLKSVLLTLDSVQTILNCGKKRRVFMKLSESHNLVESH